MAIVCSMGWSVVVVDEQAVVNRLERTGVVAYHLPKCKTLRRVFAKDREKMTRGCDNV